MAPGANLVHSPLCDVITPPYEAIWLNRFTKAFLTSQGPDVTGSGVEVSANQTGLVMCTHQALKTLLGSPLGEVIFFGFSACCCAGSAWLYLEFL